MEPLDLFTAGLIGAGIVTSGVSYSHLNDQNSNPAPFVFERAEDRVAPTIDVHGDPYRDGSMNRETRIIALEDQYVMYIKDRELYDITMTTNDDVYNSEAYHYNEHGVRDAKIVGYNSIRDAESGLDFYSRNSDGEFDFDVGYRMGPNGATFQKCVSGMRTGNGSCLRQEQKIGIDAIRRAIANESPLDLPENSFGRQ